MKTPPNSNVLSLINFLSNTFVFIFSFVASHFWTSVIWAWLLAFSGWFRTILEWIYRNTYPPLFLYRLKVLSDQKFEGLNNSFKLTNSLKKVLYSIYTVSKSRNLITEPKEPILSLTAYNEKKKDRSHIFFQSCEDNINEIFDISPKQKEYFDLLLQSFKIVCPNYITGEQAWLFIHCVGGIFGAVYQEPFYWDLICLTSKLTIENEDSPIESEDSLNLFIEILGMLIPSETFHVKFTVVVLSEIEKFNDDKLTINAVDKKRITCKYLLMALQ